MKRLAQSQAVKRKTRTILIIQDTWVSTIYTKGYYLWYCLFLFRIFFQRSFKHIYLNLAPFFFLTTQNCSVYSLVSYICKAISSKDILQVLQCLRALLETSVFSVLLNQIYCLTDISVIAVTRNLTLHFPFFSIKEPLYSQQK